ncbi:MAG TPA: serine hydrolase domain-containing protein [Acidimicrobiales bacterium]|nr:serine hydrolase domain-containing protein [Acidimicrobiales bacterium]
MIEGDVDDGYGKVADAFRSTFERGKEIGAACAVYRDGALVVDLWGGHRDKARTKRWRRDTMVTVFSTTKGMAAAAMAVAHSRGLFGLDEAVATYWPEFAQAGKAAITVRQLLSHRAGLAVIDEPLDLDVLADRDDRLASILAAQRPNWEPGTMSGYHAHSLGWYQSQLLRRVDPQRRTIGRFFADEVATPLDAAFHIGLPDDIPAERLATMYGGKPIGALLHLHEMPPKLVFAIANPRTLTGRAFNNPKALRGISDVNRRDLLRLELPSVNGTGEPRAIAKVYGELATGGAALGITDATRAELERTVELSPDRIFRLDAAFAMGFMKPFVPFGSGPRAYGHTGAGGSFGFADPDTGVGYAYAMNRAGWALPFDPRDLALREALAASLAG